MAREESQWVAMRAESLIAMNNAVEKIERRLDQHEKWHTDNLQKAKDSAPMNWLTAGMLIVSLLALVASSVIALAQH